jgi:hypothetical protein
MPKNIKAGFAASDLFPFNPDRVPKHIPKPPPELIIPNGDDAKVDPALPNDEELQTPLTPVSEEALMSLQNLISQRYTHTLDDTTKQSLDRHIQKITKAARTSLAKSAIQRDQIRFLLKVNNEAKVRRATKSIILGKAKVMSYEDLVEARAKRAEKEAAKANGGKGKGRRSRKPKSVPPEREEAPVNNGDRSRKPKETASQVDELGPKSKAERMVKVPEMARVVETQMSDTQIAPVARMRFKTFIELFHDVLAVGVGACSDEGFGFATKSLFEGNHSNPLRHIPFCEGSTC